MTPNKFWSLPLGLGLAAVLAAGLLRGEDSPKDADWPMYGGTPARNLYNPMAKNLPTDWSVAEKAPKGLKWKATLGTTSYGGPTVAGGKVFVGTNNQRPRNPAIKGDKGVVMCFDAADGSFLWQAVHDKMADPNANDWPQQGIASSPAVEGNRAYYVSNQCELVCVDTQGFLDGKNDGAVQDEKYTGKNDADFIWRLDMAKELGVHPHYLANGSPLIAGDLVFVVTGNGVSEEMAGDRLAVPAPNAPSFVAVDKLTGKVVWQDSSPGKEILEGQWSNPCYGTANGKPQVIFPGGDGWLYAFEPTTGKLIWKFDCNPKAAVFKLGGRGSRNSILATPVVHEGRCYVGVGLNPDDGPGEGHLYCIDMGKTGDVSAELVEDATAKPVKAKPNPNSAMVWHYGGPAPQNDPSGREFVFGRTLSTCAVADGIVYVAELDGFLHCVDAATGKNLWLHDLRSGCWASPFIADGKVFIGNDDGVLLTFSHAKVKKQLTTYEIERPLKGPVVAVDSALYILTDTTLFKISK